MNNSSFDALPLELWAYIAAFLPIASLSNFSMVCRMSYRAVQSCLGDWLEKSGADDVLKIDRLSKIKNVCYLRLLKQGNYCASFWPAELPFRTDAEFERYISAALYADRVLVECPEKDLGDIFEQIRRALKHLGVVRLLREDVNMIVHANNVGLVMRGMDAVVACRAFFVSHIQPKSILKERTRTWMNRDIFRLFVSFYLKGDILPLHLVSEANEFLQEAEDLFHADPTAFCNRLLRSDLSGLIVGHISTLHGFAVTKYLQALIRGEAPFIGWAYERARPGWISDLAWDALVAARQPLALAAR